jgi:hypothetical protein
MIVKWDRWRWMLNNLDLSDKVIDINSLELVKPLFSPVQLYR